MDSFDSIPLCLQQQPVSFSFDNPHHHGQLYERSISKCLRLKTNQSIDDRQPSNDVQYDNWKKNSKIQQKDNEHCRRLIQQENELRIESLTKQYELRLSKQQEYYQLRQWKLRQQASNLQKQNGLLAEQLRRAKIAPRQQQANCSICKDGEIITHYNKMLSENEEHHRNCLNEKKQMLKKLQETTAKLQTLEEEHEKVCQDLRSINRQMRGFQSKMRQVQNQRDMAIGSISQVQYLWKGKVAHLENQSKQLQKQLAHRSKELTHSKATIQSTQSIITNQQCSLKSSYLRQKDPRQEKQNQQARPRHSLNKVTIRGQADIEDQESRVCLQKLSQNMPKYGRNQKHQTMKWKYF